jgi:hypothetical protein
MKTHPILFNTEMVQAILQGRKTQTRRTKGLKNINTDPSNWKIEQLKSLWAKSYINGFKELKKPYEVGDILWVRESFENFEATYNPHGNPFEIQSFLKIQFKADRKISNEFSVENFKALNALCEIQMNKGINSKYRPSIHMPKAAARIFLKIKDVRIERLFDISEIDSQMEGVSFEIVNGTKEYKDYINSDHTFPVYAKHSFISLWEKINGEKSIESNPWVWVIEFERTEKPKNF